ncbi:NAD(P)/FAD-dependent oxidoreductase [Aerococcaceae bacterium DSM 111021]|nr:NAD(P)/FAD-dependent oxidoreductase [Aerococcaceae bacterium DSM 111021]
MSFKESLFDITIVGGGPVGLFTAFYAGLRNAKTKIIESLESLGGQPAHLYAEKNIYDIPGYPAVKGDELERNLIRQLSRFDITIQLGEEVLHVNKKIADEGFEYFEIITNEQIHYSRTVILAIGNGAFSPRKLSLPDAEMYEDSNLHYYVNNIEQFTGRTVAICGGGDSAVDWALALEPLANKVYLIHRRDKFRAVESSVMQLENSTVELLTPYIPDSINGDNNHIQSINLKKVKSDETMSLEIDNFIVSYGFTSSIGEIRKWGFNLNRNTIEVNSQYETNIPGIYAVGDIAHYEGKVRIIATGFGEAPQAVNHALLKIDPTNVNPPIHSSDLF